MNNDFFAEMLQELQQPETYKKSVGKTEINVPYRTKKEEQGLKMRQRKGERIPGRAVWKNGRRVRKVENFTQRDYSILILLSKTRYASTTQLAMLQMVQPNTISKRMQLLENINIAKGFTMVEGGKKIWSLTQKGLNLLHKKKLIPEDEGQKGFRSTEKIGHYLAITQTYIMFLYGKVLNDLGPIPINNLLSERYIERAFREFSTSKEEIYFRTRRLARDAFQAASETGQWDKVSQVSQVWVPLHSRNNSYHLPDLAVSLEADRNSSTPVSYAVEVELSIKKQSVLIPILEMYKNSKQYKEVIYVVHDDKTFRQVAKAANKIGMKNIRFVKLLGKDWKPYTGLKAWDL